MELAQLLGQLGVFFTCASTFAPGQREPLGGQSPASDLPHGLQLTAQLAVIQAMLLSQSPFAAHSGHCTVSESAQAAPIAAGGGGRSGAGGGSGGGSGGGGGDGGGSANSGSAGAGGAAAAKYAGAAVLGAAPAIAAPPPCRRHSSSSTQLWYAASSEMVDTTPAATSTRIVGSVAAPSPASAPATKL